MRCLFLDLKPPWRDGLGPHVHPYLFIFLGLPVTVLALLVQELDVPVVVIVLLEIYGVPLLATALAFTSAFVGFRLGLRIVGDRWGDSLGFINSWHPT